MKQELEQKIYDAFPELFDWRAGDTSLKIKLPWGFEHGDGWFQILWILCDSIIEENDTGFRFSQIKEKFGQLRIYGHCLSKKINDLIHAAERQSGKTCEFCGTTENVTQSGSWIKTLCKECREKKESGAENSLWE